MLHARLPRLVLLALVACCLVPTPGSAQIGGFLKKKIKSAVKGDSAAAAEKSAPAAPTFDEYVLQITSGSLDRLERGITAEKAFRDSVNAVYATRTPKIYEKCQQDAMRSPEGQKRSANPPSDQAGMIKQMAETQAWLEKRCGPGPNTFDKDADLAPAGKVAATASGMKPAQFSIMKERIVPFCRGGGAAKVPGAMKGMYYVYTADEMAALQPRCTKLLALLGKEFDTESGAAVGKGPTFEGDVIEMTPDVLTRLEKYYTTLDARLATAKAPPAKADKATKTAWNQCAQQYFTGPEGQGFMQRMAAGGQQKDGAAMAQAMKDAVEKKCGPSPEGVVVSKSSARDEAARAAGLTSGQISLLEERISPVCSTIAAEPGKPFSARYQRLYSPVELKALTTRCARLGPLVDKHIGGR